MSFVERGAPKRRQSKRKARNLRGNLNVDAWLSEEFKEDPRPGWTQHSTCEVAGHNKNAKYNRVPATTEKVRKAGFHKPAYNAAMQSAAAGHVDPCVYDHHDDSEDLFPEDSEGEMEQQTQNTEHAASMFHCGVRKPLEVSSLNLPGGRVLHRGTVVSLVQDAAARYLICSIFGKASAGSVHHMVQARKLLWARDTFLGNSGQAKELFVTAHAPGFSVSDISEILECKFIPAPESRADLAEWIQQRDIVVKKGVEHYSFLYLQEHKRMCAFQRGVIPHRGWFLTGQDGCIHAEDVQLECQRSLLLAPDGLRTLDLMAGAGGLSASFSHVGLINSSHHWAVECWETAANSFRANHPSATVLHARCEAVVSAVLQRQPHPEVSLQVDNRAIEEGRRISARELPGREDVDLLLAGPQCQGFSKLNSFPDSVKARHDRSGVPTVLSFVDAVKPALLCIENVPGFAVYADGEALQQTLSCLVSMGYQVSVEFLNAADVGDAQNRRRIVIKAALPWVKLPAYTEPTHGNAKIGPNVKLHDGTRIIPHPPAPSHMNHITLQEVMQDLPLDAVQAESGSLPGADNTAAGVVKYRKAWSECSPSIQHMREAGSTHVTLHVCKSMSSPGRDKVSRLYHPQVSRACWYLPAKCVTCTPHLNSRSGGDVHPLEDRYFSARECLRIQGMRDSFTVQGKLKDVYVQIGNLVPGNLGVAVAKKFKECVVMQ